MILSHVAGRTLTPFTRGSIATPLLAELNRLRYGTLDVVLPDGEIQRLEGTEKGPSAHMALCDPGKLLRKVLLRGSVGFAESFMDGHWYSEDLTALVHLLALNEDALRKLDKGSVAARLLDRLQHKLRRNSMGRSRRNIAYHYDLGNDFYRLWLDETMTYSSAFLDSAEQDLASGQRRKYRRMLERIGARPGDHILEIGCGWGGFAEEAARAGCRVTGITLSTEQLAFARERMYQAGLSDRVEFQLRDYRTVNEQFDHIVSIEMLEAVGEQYWQGYLETLRRCLRPGGRAALQFIIIADEFYEQYRESADFIQMYIFPGGMLPCPGVFGRLAGKAGLAVTDTQTFGQDYGYTLRHWDRRVREASHRIRALGYDKRFLRMWHYYLAYCEAGFRTGRIDVMQCTLQPAADSNP